MRKTPKHKDRVRRFRESLQLNAEPVDIRPVSPNSDNQGATATNTDQCDQNLDSNPCRTKAREMLLATLTELPRPLSWLDHLVYNYCLKHLEGEAAGDGAWIEFLELSKPILSKRPVRNRG